MAKNVLLGYKKFKSKSGVDLEVMFLASDLKENDVLNGGAGKFAEQVFVPKSMIGYLKPDFIGKELVLDYEVSNGRAYLQGFQVKK